MLDAHGHAGEEDDQRGQVYVVILTDIECMRFKVVARGRTESAAYFDFAGSGTQQYDSAQDFDA